MPNPAVHWQIQTEQPPGLLEVPLGDDGRVCVLDRHWGSAVFGVGSPDQLPWFLIDTKNCGTHGRLT